MKPGRATSGLRRGTLASAAVIALIGAGVTGCPSHAPETAQPSFPANFQLAAEGCIPVGPITYFEQACAGCHGPYGTFYGEGFATRLSEEQLARVVHDMVIGPSRGSLDARSMDALVAYHRHLAESPRRPFVAITRFDSEAISGDVSPNSTVEVVVDGTMHIADIDGHTWQLHGAPLPKNSLVVRARSGDGSEPETELDAAMRVNSHDSPR